MILYRIAKVSDAKQIAQIHYSVRHKHPLGIFSQMGFSFLKQYYRVILDDPYEIIICAENDKREIVGFNSGTLDANWQMNTLRRHKLSLGLAALGSIICNPRLIKPLVQRLSVSEPLASSADTNLRICPSLCLFIIQHHASSIRRQCLHPSVP